MRRWSRWSDVVLMLLDVGHPADAKMVLDGLFYRSKPLSYLLNTNSTICVSEKMNANFLFLWHFFYYLFEMKTLSQDRAGGCGFLIASGGAWCCEGCCDDTCSACLLTKYGMKGCVECSQEIWNCIQTWYLVIWCSNFLTNKVECLGFKHCFNIIFCYIWIYSAIL